MAERRPYRGPSRRSGHYTSRSGPNRVLRTVAVVFFVIFLLFALALFFLQDYMVYSDSGIRLELPWLKESTPPPALSPLITSPIVTNMPASSAAGAT